MEQFIQAKIYNEKELQRINRCRIYLQVQNLSEISDGTGNSITHCIRNHIRDPERKSKYKWTHQPFPKKNDWEVWDDALYNVWSNEIIKFFLP